MVLPLFFLAICCLCYLLEIVSIQITIRSALDEVGREVATEAYGNPFVSSGELEEKIVKHIGSEKLERSIIVQGKHGLDLSKTRILGRSRIIQMCVEYKVKLPIYTFGKLSLSCKEEFNLKGWTGYEKGIFSQDKEDIVYITETGMVYHRSSQCTYLDLSIHMVGKKDVKMLRNKNGEKYKNCEKCGRKAGGNVYITNHGNRYHKSIGCSGLKRKVYAIPISEALGKGECSRCGQ
ncbi:pilus assembly protein [Faecalimonas sp.]